MKPLWETVTKVLLNLRHLLLIPTPVASHFIQGSNKASQAQSVLAKSLLTVSECLDLWPCGWDDAYHLTAVQMLLLAFLRDKQNASFFLFTGDLSQLHSSCTSASSFSTVSSTHPVPLSWISSFSKWPLTCCFSAALCASLSQKMLAFTEA